MPLANSSSSSNSAPTFRFAGVSAEERRAKDAEYFASSIFEQDCADNLKPLSLPPKQDKSTSGNAAKDAKAAFKAAIRQKQPKAMSRGTESAKIRAEYDARLAAPSAGGAGHPLGLVTPQTQRVPTVPTTAMDSPPVVQQPLLLGPSQTSPTLPSSAHIFSSSPTGLSARSCNFETPPDAPSPASPASLSSPCSYDGSTFVESSSETDAMDTRPDRSSNIKNLPDVENQSRNEVPNNGARIQLRFDGKTTIKVDGAANADSVITVHNSYTCSIESPEDALPQCSIF